jgi:hypothetical protein
MNGWLPLGIGFEMTNERCQMMNDKFSFLLSTNA